MPEITRPKAPDADLSQVGLLWVDLSQIDRIARRLPKKRNSLRGKVAVHSAQRTPGFDR